MRRLTIHRFTLLELLAAITLTSILFAGVAGIFYQSFRFRNMQAERNDVMFAHRACMAQLAADLSGILPPGELVGELTGETDEDDDCRMDSITFFTNSNRQDIGHFGADFIKIGYELRAPQDNDKDDAGYDLVRLVSSNLLSEDEEAEEEILLSGVRSLEITYHNGTEWVDSWEKASEEQPLPALVKLRVTLKPEGDLLPKILERVVRLDVSPLPKKAQQGGQS